MFIPFIVFLNTRKPEAQDKEGRNKMRKFLWKLMGKSGKSAELETDADAELKEFFYQQGIMI